MRTSAIQLAVTFLASAFISSSAFGDSTPKCSDTAVKEAVVSTSEATISDSLMRRFGSEHGMGVSPTLKFTEMKKWAEEDGQEDERFAQIVEQVESLIEEVSISLINIRTRGTRESVDKSYCEADLLYAHNGVEFAFTYTAQLTDAGKLYVEVSGL